MVKLKFGSIVTSGSGSLGGHTVQNSRGGVQLRKKPIARNQPSAAQYKIRSINKTLQAGWRDLTDEQRDIWNMYAVTRSITNKTGDRHPLSGHSLWMKYNYYWLAAGGGFLQHPSEWDGPILGPELIRNGTFDIDQFWIKEISWSISGGKAHYSAAFTRSFYQFITLPAGFPCRIAFDISDAIGDFKFYFQIGGDVRPFGPEVPHIITGPNGHYFYMTSLAVDITLIAFTAYATHSAFSLDNVSLRQIL